MQTLARLFGRSPFAPLQTHMAKVALCVKELDALFLAVENQNYDAVERIAEKISQLEHEADLSKNDIRNHLPSGLFMPITRESLLEILSLQDDIADKTENIAILLTLKALKIESILKADFTAFLKKNLETFHEVHLIIQEFGELLESSFGGSEAEKVKAMVHSVAFKEHECDLLQRKLLKTFFTIADDLPTSQFYLWMKVTQEVAALSDISESLANRVRMTLEVK